MAHKTLVDGTAYEVIGGKTLVGGTIYEITCGRTLNSGAIYEISFIAPPDTDLANILVDFTYTDNGDGTATITGWKGTKNGVASTELLIPDDSRIIL